MTAVFPLDDPQAWIVTALAIAAAALLLRSLRGPRRKGGCASCAPSRPPAARD